LEEERGPLILPVPIMSEVAYMIEALFGVRLLSAFLEDIEAGGYTLDCCLKDVGAIRELVNRYSDLPLGLADGSVIACAERSGKCVMTLDRRHFDVVGRELGLTVLP
jgi:hypothetical protein